MLRSALFPPQKRQIQRIALWSKFEPEGCFHCPSDSLHFTCPAYAEAILIAYNAKCKNRLPMKKLYGKEYDEDIDDDEDEIGQEASM